MYKKILQLYLLLFTTLLFAQNNKDNNIANKYPSDPTLLNSLARKHLYKAGDTTIIFTNLAIKEAESHNNTYEKAKAIHIKGLHNSILGDNDKAKIYFEKSIKLLKDTPLTDIYIQNILELGMIIYSWGEYDTAYSYFEKALINSRKIGYWEGIAKAHNYIGKYYHSVGKFDKSYDFFKSSYNLFTRLNNRTELAEVQNNLGKHYDTQGKYTKALKYYLNSLKILEEQNNQLILGTSYNHIGNIYFNLGKTSEALKYHYKALKVRSAINYTEGIAKSYKNIAQTYIGVNKLDTALYYLNKSIKLIDKVGYAKGKIKCLNLLGLVFEKKKDIEQAMKYYTEAYNYAIEINYNKGAGIAAFNIGRIHLKQKKVDLALKYLTKGMNALSTGEVNKILSEVYLNLHEAYNAQKEYQKALKYYRLYHELNTEIFNIEKTNLIAEVLLKSEMEHKEKENEILRASNEIKQLEIRQKNNLILAISLGLLLMIIFAVITFILFRGKNKANILLKELNKKVTVQNKELEELNKKLNQANSDKDKFFSIIAHELRNPLWWFRNLTEVLSKNFDKMSKDKLQSATQALDESAKNAFHLIDNLLQWSKTELGRIVYKPAVLDIKNLIDENIALVHTIAEAKNIKITNNIPNESIVWADKNMISTVVRNIISNALKYTPSKGFVEINSEIKNKHLIISISDTGIGIDEKNIKKINDENIHYSTLGLYHEKGSGIGLNLCKKFIYENKGKLNIHSQLNKGTSFSFDLPLYLGSTKKKTTS